MNEEKLNDYIENKNDFPSDEGRDFLKMVKDFKSLKAKPDKNFSNKLQSKIIKEFKTSSKRGYKEIKLMEKFNYKVFWSATAMAAVIVLAIFGLSRIYNVPTNTNQNVNQIVASKEALPKFASCSALTSKLKENYDKTKDEQGIRDYGAVFGLGAPMAQKSTSEENAPTSSDYSQTNIQVAGVDEADIVKTDGQYIYSVSGSNIFITKAYPASEAKLLAKIEIKGTPSEIFIDSKNLLVFGSRNQGYIEEQYSKEIAPPYPYYQYLTFVEIYNLDNPEKPELKRKLEFEGNYNSSRKIDNYVYFVLNSYPDYRLYDENTNAKPSEPVPLYRDLSGSMVNATDVDFQGITNCVDVSYIEPVVSNQYLTVVGLPIDNYSKEITKEVILGSAENIYASTGNLYVANTTWQYYDEPNILQKIFGTSGSEEKTNIYKFSLDKDKIKYLGQASVPGTILNQFSMDEYSDYFRIATTIGYVSQQGGNATNNVYILDKDLKTVGSLTNIAPGEEFYSTRFIGNRAYLVTFKKVDPFFTVDLTDPKNPKILGKLKIPGYSDYLHPYDENHIIGIGKETEEAEEGNFAWYQGIKMAIFDVTDVTNPKELFKTVIGDRGTDSPILTDHKAFLFSKEKNLLVIPITLAEIPESVKSNTNTPSNTYGDYVYQGSYVYDISLDKGFILKGRVTHYENDEVFKKTGYYYGGDNLTIKRNLYIDDSLYSISNGKIMINALADLSKQGEIVLPVSQSSGSIEEPLMPGV